MGEVEYLHRRVLECFGKSNEERKNSAKSDAVHSDDLPAPLDYAEAVVDFDEFTRNIQIV